MNNKEHAIGLWMTGVTRAVGGLLIVLLHKKYIYYTKNCRLKQLEIKKQHILQVANKSLKQKTLDNNLISA